MTARSRSRSSRTASRRSSTDTPAHIASPSYWPSLKVSEAESFRVAEDAAMMPLRLCDSTTLRLSPRRQLRTTNENRLLRQLARLGVLERRRHVLPRGDPQPR